MCAPLCKEDFHYLNEDQDVSLVSMLWRLRVSNVIQTILGSSNVYILL